MKNTCEICIYLKTFVPRQDEKDRYGYDKLGYGCIRPNYEGYTQLEDTCNFFYNRFIGSAL